MTQTIRQQLIAALRTERDVPGQWGVVDCRTWVGKCAAIVIGHDPTAFLDGQYASEGEAKRLLARHGCRDMGDAAATLFPEVPLAQARTGDWAHFRDDHGNDCLGVVIGHQITIRTLTGLSLAPLASAQRVFRVA